MTTAFVGIALRPLRRFIGKTRRIIAWLPVLWQDEDWDYSCMVRLLVFKLRRMADCIERNGFIVDADKVARRMRVVCAHLERSLNIHDFDSAPVMPPHERTFTKMPGGGVFVDPLPPELERAVTQWAYKCNELEAYHWDRAWEMIRKHGRGWWD